MLNDCITDFDGLEDLVPQDLAYRFLAFVAGTGDWDDYLSEENFDARLALGAEEFKLEVFFIDFIHIFR